MKEADKMTCNEVLKYLKDLAVHKTEPTIDTLKTGDGNKEAKKIAVCFIATPNVIRQAYEWGADLLITHEPTYHDHHDRIEEEPVNIAKRRLIEETKLTIVRFHDHAHGMVPDVIHYGFMEKTGLDYDFDEQRGFVTLKNAISPVEMAECIKKNLKLNHVRVIGKTDFSTKNVALYLGACGDAILQPLRTETPQIVIGGETSEWRDGEWYRDAGELGMSFALILLGHAGSERDGMEYMSRKIKIDLGVETKYIECGETYV